MALDAYGVEYASRCCRSNRRHKYDVFLSFRGEDTRKSFTDHLYTALHDNGLITFRDEEELERGEVIKPSLYQAIEDSFSAIVVLSKNYATSTWCLDELVRILQHKKVLRYHVFPIFYGVDPSSVRHQRGSFEEAFVKHEQKFAYDKVQRWRDALKEVANISGWNSQDYRYETKLIKIVVEMVRSKLDELLDSNDEGAIKLVGIDEKIADFDSSLANTLGEVQFIGIWGMGGLGKTTLARAVYERMCKKYEVHAFLQNVREESAKYGGLVSLQQKLLSHSKRTIKTEVVDYYEGRKLIQRRLSNTKVLLVLDDVSDISQLENLGGKEWFGKGSRIIITTRDKHLLDEYGVSKYKMNFLNQVESYELFVQKAFGGNYPNEDYLELCKTVIRSAKGLPLALEVFGSFLCGRSKSEWEDALRKVPPNNILEILKVSFDGLEYNEKNIFLDIACFLNGMTKDSVMQILVNVGFYPEIGIKVLIDKSLVTEDERCLRVHDMLQKMAKKIVFCESPNDAGKRSRIWSLEDSNHVLGKKRGTETIHGIAVRFDKPYIIHLDPEAFSSMSNLKLLIISSHSQFSHCQLHILHGINCLSYTLKVIEWQGYPLNFLPNQTQLDEIVHLKMQHSKLKEPWRGDQFLQSLKFLDLSHSTYLTRTLHFDKMPCLQRLILEGCTKLIEVHYSLGQHKNLVTVDFTGCRSIKTLPPKLEMNCLETFVLSGCSKVKKLPEFGKSMEHLSRLDLEGTAISKLPQSLVNLIGLATLNLKNCKNLVCLPSDFQNLKAIKNINIFGCSKFSRLPENLNENKALEELDVGETAIKELPLSLNNLKVLSLRGCTGLISRSSKLLRSPSFSNLSSLVTLRLSYCNLRDESLSSEISNLSSLATLDLSGNNFVEFPSGLISKLRKLERIGLNDCPRLQSLPQLPSNLSIIQAGDCPSLKHYLRPQQLWEFIVQFESQTRPLREILGQEWKCRLLSDNVSAIVTWDPQYCDFFMQPTRILTIPGSEVPSWFDNQSYFCEENFPYEYTPANVSFIVNKPDSWCSSELWGIAVCLVLENEFESVKFDDVDALCWTYRVSDGKYSNSYRGCDISMQSSCRHQRCIIYIRFSSFVVEQLQMVFFTYNKGEQKKLIFKIGQCGWRLLCKEDVERWQDNRDERCSSKNNDKLFVPDESITSVEPSPLDRRLLRLCLKFLWPIGIIFIICYLSLK